MSRVKELIKLFNLEPLAVEGGMFQVAFRSSKLIETLDGRKGRIALSGIYFLLQKGEVSRLHRVKSDEVWHFYEGAEVELFILDENTMALERHILGKAGSNSTPMVLVPAGKWQCARSLGEYSFVGCNVAPGFEYEDFEVAEDREFVEKVLAKYLYLREFV